MQDIILKIEENIWKSIPNERRIGLLTGLSGLPCFIIICTSIWRCRFSK